MSSSSVVCVSHTGGRLIQALYLTCRYVLILCHSLVAMNVNTGSEMTAKKQSMQQLPEKKYKLSRLTGKFKGEGKQNIYTLSNVEFSVYIVVLASKNLHVVITSSS